MGSNYLIYNSIIYEIYEKIYMKQTFIFWGKKRDRTLNAIFFFFIRCTPGHLASISIMTMQRNFISNPAKQYTLSLTEQGKFLFV